MLAQLSKLCSLFNIFAKPIIKQTSSLSYSHYSCSKECEMLLTFMSRLLSTPTFETIVFYQLLSVSQTKTSYGRKIKLDIHNKERHPN